MRFKLAIAVLASSVCVSIAPSQTRTSKPPVPEIKQASASPFARQRFVCNTGYSQEACKQQMPTLRAVLQKYPVVDLGEWTWVLVRSRDWKNLLTERSLNSNIPAITLLDKRITFFEEALVTDVPGRGPELILQWGSSLQDLLELSVSHELGHALCHETDEGKADAHGRFLRNQQEFSCKTYSYLKNNKTSREESALVVK